MLFISLVQESFPDSLGPFVGGFGFGFFLLVYENET